MKAACDKMKFRPKSEAVSLWRWNAHFLNEKQLSRLFELVRKYFDLMPDAEIAIEVEPRTVSHSQLKLLRALGFNRISMGVQDFDEKVQKAINRIHSYDMIKPSLMTAGLWNLTLSISI